ncbi:PREDICTED: nuclear pore complex protein NUP107 isoform X2 [Brassica oleracea var. oleracea]|uniref:nuclear pore complex protein NUP107 isoform X2 n=1 Tax=Brassica oleracea var. oleracea TaxID=109376 RepID=UPI0006A70B7E|nr:PREDICTED: nuclear pore complex protein NUP107 isoform X2 [Brassica oleracea var. oleracea]
MDTDMDTSPSYFDPEVLSVRDQFRRYRKRHSTSPPHEEVSSPNVSENRLLYDGDYIHSPTNTALLLENIKEEVDSFHTGLYEAEAVSAASRRESGGDLDGDDDEALFRRVESQSLKACKVENDELAESGDTTFALFASLFDSALQGLMPIPDLILRLEESCRDVSQSIRYGSDIRHRVVEDKLMRQKAQLLLGEAASWSLLWNLYGKATEEVPQELIMSPSTSHLEACQFVVNDHTAQLCLRIVLWLEDLASKSLDLERKVRGSHVGTYLPNAGVWHHTQRYLKKNGSAADTVRHLDFDAPTREHARLLPDDKKQDESLLEDVWILLRAGRIEEACDLCRSAGQPWRAATLCPFSGMDMFPSVEALIKNGKNRTLQAIELESGFGNQLRLWKWASYCASEKIAEQDGGKHEVAVFANQCSNLNRILPICTDWESACWAMAKSWLDVQVDLELAQSKPGLTEKFRSCLDESPETMQNGYQASLGPEDWPLHVLNQQPRDLPALLQKLHSGEMVHDAVVRGCKEQHRQIQMTLMSGNISHLLDIIWSWIAIQWLCFTPPSTIKDVKDVTSKLLLRSLMHSNILFREFALIAMWRVPATPVGAHTLLSFLAEPLKHLSENPDTLEDYVSENLQEFQAWNEYYSCDAKYRNWLKFQLENAEVTELSEEENQKAVVAAKETLDSSLSLLLRKDNPWLTFLEDDVFESEEHIFLELHATAMLCLPSGECLRPDATVCVALMSALYASVTEEVVLDRQLMVNVSISSRDSYCIEVVLRCLATEGDGLGPHNANDGGILSSVAAAAFKGELTRFQAGVTMDISRLDAWYSSKEGSLETPATYIVRGLCRRCCLPELVLRSMQVSVCLMESGNPPEEHDELIELVASDENGFLSLFSQQQLQEFMLFEREYRLSQLELQEELSSS